MTHRQAETDFTLRATALSRERVRVAGESVLFVKKIENTNPLQSPVRSAAGSSFASGTQAAPKGSPTTLISYSTSPFFFSSQAFFKKSARRVTNFLFFLALEVQPSVVIDQSKGCCRCLWLVILRESYRLFSGILF